MGVLVGDADIGTEAESDLFPLAPDCLPQALPGETLYSWCARYHRLNGGNNPRATSRRLFGHPTAGLRPELPSHLADFQDKTHGFLGSLQELLTHKTVFGLYAPFLPTTHIAEISKHLAGGNSVAARCRLGASKTGQAQRSPLRFCPDCVREQMEAHAVSWWQTEHLWPSLCVCPRHGSLLIHGRSELLERASADFYLAHELDASRLRSPPAPTPLQHRLLSRLAAWTTTIAKLEDSSFDEATLRVTYLMQARQRSWLTLDGALRLQSLQDAFLSQCGCLSSFPEFRFVADADGVNGGFLGSLFRQYPGRRHPSKHIVLMSFLFAEPEELFSTYATMRTAITQDGPQGAQKLLTDTSRRLVDLIEEAGHSASAAAGKLKITPREALAHLKSKTNIKRPRRPHIVGTARENQLRRMLATGRSRREIVETLSVRPAFIKDYLGQRPELKAQWEKAHLAIETQTHRAQLLAALSAHPGVPIKSIRRIPHNGFQWLYNNDREWLQEVLPAIWKR